MLKITVEQVQNFIHERYVERGEQIFKNGDVVFEQFSDNSATAFCCGTQVYTVQLSLGKSGLSGYCSCPAFLDFGPCKHLAAAALAVIAKNRGRYVANQWAIDRVEAMMELRSQIASLEKSEIIDLLFHCADEETIKMILDRYE